MTIRGEYETGVCDGPTFKHKIEISKSKRIWDSRTDSGYLEVDEAGLLQKKGTR